MLIPVHFEHGFPVFSAVEAVSARERLAAQGLSRKAHSYELLFASGFTDGDGRLKRQWQWNHLPDASLFSLDGNEFTIRTDRLSINVTQAVNTLTQRLMFPSAEVQVRLDGAGMKNGDVAGLVALQGCYAYAGFMRENNKYYLVLVERNAHEISQNMGDLDNLPGTETARIPLDRSVVTLRLCAEFSDMKDEVSFYYESDGTWISLGNSHKLFFTLDHFVGCRAGLFMYSTAESGGQCVFSDFIYNAVDRDR